jgi:Effector-associated domain 1
VTVQPRSLDGPGGVSGAELRDFRDALIAAFPRWADLRDFVEGNDLVGSLEVEVAGPGIPTKDVAMEFLKAQQAKGCLQRVLEKALGESNHFKLVAFARLLGHEVRLNAYEDLSVETFDLYDHEKKWRKAFGASLAKRVILFVTRDADQEMLDPLVRRLHRYVGEHSRTSAHGPQTLTLSATLSNLNDAITRVKRLSSTLSSKPVLLRIYGERAQSEVVVGFLDGVKQHFSNGLRQHLVMIMNVCGSCALAPHEFIELPSWSYEDDELNLWIMDVAGRFAWEETLVTQFRAYILDRSRYGGADPTAGSLYDTLQQVIDFLRKEPTHEDLCAWLRRTD